MIDSTIQQAITDGYLTTDEDREEEQVALRRKWGENRMALRLPYIEIQPHANDMVTLGYNVKHIRIASNPARMLLKHVHGEIGKRQRSAGQANYCAIEEIGPHVGKIGPVPMWVAIQVAKEINEMAPLKGKR